MCRKKITVESNITLSILGGRVRERSHSVVIMMEKIVLVPENRKI